MNIELLRHDTLRFRKAIEKCLHQLDPVIFGKFPRGCCGAVSELLAAFLQSQGYGSFTYVMGLRFEGDLHYSHAWLERDDYIIDITKDQFDEHGEHNFVSDNRSWYDSRFFHQERQETPSDLPMELCVAYGRILNELG